MSETPKISSKVDFFRPQTWQNGELKKEIEAESAVPEDTRLSGGWGSAYNPQDLDVYKQSLEGKPLKSYDPEGFFKRIGLPDNIESSGRGDVEMLKAAAKIAYKPEPTYIPAPTWVAGPVQKVLLALGKVFPGFVKGIDELIDSTMVKKREKPDQTDPFPFGREEDVVKGAKTELPLSQRYFGLSAQLSRQHAWAEGVHEGSVKPTPGRPAENFGTYDVALKMGFTEEQAKRIAESDNAVDTDQTHYLQNGRPRITKAGSGGDNGDLHWHFNRAPEGREDTRITAARTHLERAVKFAKEGYCEAAERELGIGLHSLQDMFSHGQINPFNHSLLGDFPDMVEANPVGMYDTALATEGYLKCFAREVGIRPLVSATPHVEGSKGLMAMALPSIEPAKWSLIQNLVRGDASPEQQLVLAKRLANCPKELLSFLSERGVTLFLGKQGTRATDLGFGLDLDQDGKISNDKWVDVNQDEKKQAYEVEDKLADGRKWSELPAAYDDEKEQLFLSSDLLGDSAKLDAALHHEILHAIDGALTGDKVLGEEWKAYRTKVFDLARREGRVSFDQNLDEYLAQ
ncbi:MAG TPA: hypothetical protein DD435_09210 [Cyanobacteria bacterium UBA8530]|nr:hypothetical protein [Cyanobacteria bacterium UBA8530]